eukprot:gnl/TRDRNA2_/TRDRNA2_83361_c1_seq1.p2 gnl/TRDRNA2_/TRDRNA2_83361_c1~~gnl/TRDRNA2_/TRDRNA2_83361_c1_seq1.p2  ORF type:complete len:100 (-),score=27.78 gnl/TRDRNA2_/TRDRNA2_83361_c1_seq1:370-669(-)
MTEEERKNPNLFFDDSSDDRVSRIADTANFDAEGISQFLKEFKMMRSMMSRLAKGESAEDIEKDMAEEDGIEEGNRRSRRSKNKPNKRYADKAKGGGFR